MNKDEFERKNYLQNLKNQITI